MKQVHWQLPFASLDGNHYRIDIYAEGTPVGGIKQLTGGATPFTTDEDNSDDFFAPVRSQTGCINIIDEDGTLMESGIMPSDKVDKPVRLIRVSDGAVMWQGFLSCETYSQAYTSRPNEVTLNVNSVLEAMKSVYLTDYNFPQYGCGSIGYWLEEINRAIAPNQIEFEIPTSIKYVYTDNSGDRPRYIEQDIEDGVYIQAGAFFEEKEYPNSDGIIDVRAESVSCYDIIANICTLFGLVARECGTSIYFEICDDLNRYNSSFSHLRMSELTYKGDEHQMSVSNGAKSVEVKTNTKDDSVLLDLPDTPGYPKLTIVTTGYDYCQLLQDKHNTWSNFWFRQTAGTVSIRVNTDSYSLSQIHEESWNGVSHITDINRGSGAYILVDNYTQVQKTGVIHAGACFARIVESVRDNTKPTQGVFLQMIPVPNDYNLTTWGQPIMTADSVISRQFNAPFNPDWRSSSIRIKAELDKPMGLFAGSAHADKFYIFDNDRFDKLTLFIKVYLGDECIIGTDNAPASIKVNSKGEVISSYFLPIIGGRIHNGGTIRVMIYPYLKDKDFSIGNIVTELLIKSLKVEFLPAVDIQFIAQTSAIYRLETGTGFSQEVSINSQLSTNYGNTPTACEIVDQDIEQITKIRYKYDEDTIDIRPENELLERATRYYSKPRSKIDLVVESPSVNLPNTIVTGYDKKIYLPLSESRDWKMGVSTIRCFECPDP